ncbi:hypothetical protein L2750_12530 [Shewanella submarina]|uniref:Benenodin family lasso peptide n=1 Tax=Shewanella submarina TaxID=2016376 RepID=A0ABV7GGG7_9GAMM|nr:hypothetical protein [Shewanella submarina]MCL1037976.1 hypothetical protein [Shewanella submarina]
MNSNHNQPTAQANDTTGMESKDAEGRDKLTLIEDVLIESVSGGRAFDGGICDPSQFCEIDPPVDPIIPGE